VLVVENAEGRVGVVWGLGLVGVLELDDCVGVVSVRPVNLVVTRFVCDGVVVGSVVGDDCRIFTCW